MNAQYSIIVVVISLMFLIGGIFFSSINYKKRFKTKYSILNYFPYEINYEGKFADNIFGNFAIGLSTLLIVFFYGTFDTSHENAFGLMVLIAGMLSSILIFISIFTPLKALKTHLVITSVTAIINCLLAISIVLINLTTYLQNSNVVNLVGSIIAVVVALYLFLLVINPKYSLKIKKEEITNEKGEVVISRPKFIMMAYAEWMMMFAPFMSAIPLIMYLFTIQ